jgi:hypothetical protein
MTAKVKAKKTHPEGTMKPTVEYHHVPAPKRVKHMQHVPPPAKLPEKIHVKYSYAKGDGPVSHHHAIRASSYDEVQQLPTNKPVETKAASTQEEVRAESMAAAREVLRQLHQKDEVAAAENADMMQLSASAGHVSSHRVAEEMVDAVGKGRSVEQIVSEALPQDGPVGLPEAPHDRHSEKYRALKQKYERLKAETLHKLQHAETAKATEEGRRKMRHVSFVAGQLGEAEKMLRAAKTETPSTLAASHAVVKAAPAVDDVGELIRKARANAVKATLEDRADPMASHLEQEMMQVWKQTAQEQEAASKQPGGKEDEARPPKAVAELMQNLQEAEPEEVPLQDLKLGISEAIQGAVQKAVQQAAAPEGGL